MKKTLRAIISIAIAGTLVLTPFGSGHNVLAEEQMPEFRTLMSPKGEISIVRRPGPLDLNPGKLAKLPKYDKDSDEIWQVDLRSRDLTLLDLTDRLEDLLFSSFDSKTKWPDKLPKDFNPEKIMDLGKNPGLGVRELHKKGITGKGIGIAIIDQTLFVDHEEYKDRIKMYEEIHNIEDTAVMHGAAVASIAVGKSVGVAPEADLYYIAETHAEYTEGGFKIDLTWVAKSIDRIVEVNKTLPKNKKIKVISISLGIVKKMDGYEKVLESIEKAKKEGIYTVHGESDPFLGLDRDPLKDADDINSYALGLFLQKADYANSQVLIPMDSRCTASPTGVNDYVFYRNGGISWAVPYVAGLYALACQVNPDITPETFWDAAAKTSGVNKDKLGKIINPVKLIDSISKTDKKTNNNK